MRIISGFFLLVFLVLVAIFAIQNMTMIEVHFLKSRLIMPGAALIVGAYLLGMLSGWSVIGFIRSSWRRVRGPSV